MSAASEAEKAAKREAHEWARSVRRQLGYSTPRKLIAAELADRMRLMTPALATEHDLPLETIGKPVTWPSVEDICKGVGLSDKSTVEAHLKGLRADGWLDVIVRRSVGRSSIYMPATPQVNTREVMAAEPPGERPASHRENAADLPGERPESHRVEPLCRRNDQGSEDQPITEPVGAPAPSGGSPSVSKKAARARERRAAADPVAALVEHARDRIRTGHGGVLPPWTNLHAPRMRAWATACIEIGARDSVDPAEAMSASWRGFRSNSKAPDGVPWDLFNDPDRFYKLAPPPKPLARSLTAEQARRDTLARITANNNSISAGRGPISEAEWARRQAAGTEDPPDWNVEDGIAPKSSRNYAAWNVRWCGAPNPNEPAAAWSTGPVDRGGWVAPKAPDEYVATPIKDLFGVSAEEMANYDKKRRGAA